MCQRHRIGFACMVRVFSVLLIGSHEYGFAAAPGSRAPGDSATGRAQTGRQRVQKSGSAERRSVATRPATQPASRPASSRPAAEAKTEVVAYYFHRTLRCPSCLHIEASARQVIQGRFAAELDAGLLRCEAVDMQKKGNEHFAADYKLEAPSLVLVRMVNDRQESWKNCEKVWDLHRNEPAFAEYVQGELNRMLSGQTMTAAQPGTSAGDSEPLPRLVSLGAKRLVSSKRMAPVLEQLKAELAGKAKVEFIDVFENKEAGKPYAVRVVPTQVFYDRNGKETWRHEGFLSKERILSKLREAGMP